MRTVALFVAAMSVSLAASRVEAQIVVTLGAAGAVAELDDEDVAELESIQVKRQQATFFYVGAAVLGGAGVPAVIVGAPTYASQPDIGALLAVSMGSVATLAALVYLGVAIGYDLGAASHRERWLHETGLAVDLAFRDGGGQLTVMGTF